MPCPGGQRALTAAEVQALWVSAGGPIAERVIPDDWGPISGNPSSLPTAKMFTAIAQRESGFCPNANGDSGQSYGLWQIHWPAWGATLKTKFGYNSPTELFTPAKNAKAAVFIYKEEGFEPWSTAPEVIREFVQTGQIKIGAGTRGTQTVEDAASAVVDAVAPWAKGLAKFLSIITNPTFWKAVGIGALGVIIVGISVAVYNKEDVANVATTAATKGVK